MMTQPADNLLPRPGSSVWRWLSARGETATWTGGNDESLLARHRGRVICGLVLLTVLPRILLASTLSAYCDDAYYYLWVAEMWEQGRTLTALQSLNVNVYPLILWGLQQTGMSPTTAGVVWGVSISGLTVLPLYGLLRRMFDDRIAAVSLLLFAVHPSLMELSVEPIRDSTFWFLFVLSLYGLYRAVEFRGGMWAVVGGIGFALAVHTRTEGWVLVIPLMLWPAFWSETAVSWRRRLLRIGMAGSMVPAFLLTINLTLLHDHDRWEWGRFAPLQNFVDWLRSDVSRERIELERQRRDRRGSEVEGRELKIGGRAHPRLAMIAPVPLASDAPLARTRPDQVFVYLNLFGENFEYVNLLLLLPGSILLTREMWRGDRLAMTLIFLAICGMVWIRLVQVGTINGRYFLTAYLMALPTEAVGIVWLVRLGTSAVSSPRRRSLVPAGVYGFLMAFFLAGAFTGGQQQRIEQRELGEWLRSRYGPFDEVLVDTRSTRVGYFARGRLPNVSYYNAGDAAPAPPPQAIIVRRPAVDYVRVRARQLGLRAVPRDQMPSADEFEVFVPAPRPRAVAGSDRRSRR